MDGTTIGGRVWAVRDKFGLTRNDFADRLGSSVSEIENVEYNRLKKPEQKESLYRNIAAVFGVSLEWIKTGEGDMFGADDEDGVGQAFGELAARNDPIINGFIEFLRSRTPDQLEMIAQHLEECAELLRKNK